MSLRLKFTLLFSGLVSAIIIISGLVIYFLYTGTRKDEFNKRLWAQSVKVFEGFSKDSSITQPIKNKANKYYPINITDASTVIFNNSKQVVYQTGKANMSGELATLDAIKASKEFYFSIGQNDCAGIYLSDHYILTCAFDKYGKAKQERLAWILVVVTLGGVAITTFTSFYYTKKLVTPLTKLGEEMKSISENNLKDRIKINSKKNAPKEISAIAVQFNEILDRFEKAFELQKSFVHHASHELRTPLASMLSQTESALRKELTVQEAKRVLISLKEDQQELIELTNSLLLLSQYEKVNYSNAWPIVRLDEALYETIGMTKKMFADSNVSLEFGFVPEDEMALSVRANDTLLKSAFRNLVKNAYLYSDTKNVSITLDESSDAILVHFDNDGKVLSQREQDNLFMPFFRGGNAQMKKGFGLGLSIVNRIVTLHRGKVGYKVFNKTLNRFTIELPKITE